MRANAIANTPLSWWNGATESQTSSPARQLNMPVCFQCTNCSYSEITSEKVEACSVMTALVKELCEFMATQCHQLLFLCTAGPETSLWLTFGLLKADYVLDWHRFCTKRLPRKLANNHKSLRSSMYLEETEGQSAPIFKTNNIIICEGQSL